MLLKNLLALSLVLTVIALTSCQLCTKFKNNKEVQICCPGYTIKNNCSVNSRCTGKSECTCDDGYDSSPSNPKTIVCEPECTAGCQPHSTCTQPETCTCDSGYTEGWNGTCEPVCQEPCSAHASCTAPNTCSCMDGYIFNESLEQCVPECQYGCPLNMYCQSPDQCACRTGYGLQSNTADIAYEATVSNSELCPPICSAGCPANSKCYAPEECRCSDGYIARTEEDGQMDYIDECVPKCENPCPQHANCVRPNTCECASGYVWLHPRQHRPYCQALCIQNCEQNGKCVAPDVCECFAGYEHVNSTSASSDPQELYCQPVCSNGCAHGSCVGPEMCVCQPGYLMGAQGVCEPTCTRGCQNGRCIAVNVCACNDGYQLSAHDLSKCEPICSEPCVNADCVAPDLCLCREKYQPMSGGNFTHICTPTTMTTISTDTESNDTVKVVKLTEANTGDEKGALLLSNDLGKCADACSCWKADSSEECLIICGSRETRCLEPQFSRCIEPSNRIEYKVSGLSKIYTCYMDSFMDSFVTGASARPLRTLFGLLFTAVMSVVFV